MRARRARRTWIARARAARRAGPACKSATRLREDRSRRSVRRRAASGSEDIWRFKMFHLSARLHTGLLRTRRWKKIALATAALAATGLTSWAIVTDLGLVALLHEPAAEEHGDQLELLTLVT